jgi:hypothetical protein
MDAQGGGKLPALHGGAVWKARRERVEPDRGAQIALGNRPFLRLRRGREQDGEKAG